MGAVGVPLVRMTEAWTVLAPLLGNLIGALFLQRLGWLLLGHLLLCHTLGH